MKKRFWDDIEDQETLEILNIQIEKQKLIKLKNRSGHTIRIELIKERTKRQTERINNFEKYKK